jgi:adenylate cyclase
MVPDGSNRQIFFVFGVLVKSPVLSMGFVGAKVVANTKIHPITIDLNEFKLHIALKDRKELTLHFNSPSRKFYLTVIAFVVNEMKTLGKITSIPLDGHYDLLALLNNTVGENAGSSNKEHLLPRIYRKWKDVLPNIEEGPLFKVLGKKKEYEEGVAKTYHFTEAEKDNWANLFEYKGSEENVRLKFAVDRIGAGLDDVVIIYEDAINGEAWERFTSILRDKLEVKSEKEEIEEVHKEPEIQVSQPAKIAWSSRYRWAALIVVIGVLAGTAVITMWKYYSYNAPQAETISKEKEASPSPEKVTKTVSPAPPKLEGSSKEKMPFPLPDKLSIAVLPFVNMSKDPEQEFFSDGLTEEIITTLSKSPHLFVAARTSTSAYKGKPVRVDQVAQDLGIRYVLEGSVRRSGDQVRISAKLIDAKTGHNQWAERYDGKMRDVFTIQDEIALKIMKTLQVKLGVGPDSSEARGGSKNAEAYLKSVEATEQIIRFTKDGIIRARMLFEEVIALEPDFSRGYSGLALSYGMNVYFGGSVSPKESMAQAMDLAQKAISLNETDAINHAALAYLFAITRRHDTAVARAERALALDGNSFPVVDFSGIALMYSCKGKEAIVAFEKAERLNPSFPHSPLHLSWAYRLAGRYEEAFKQAQKAVDRTPQNLLAHLALTATCNLAGREAEARAAAETVLKINPNFSAERFRNDLYLLFKDTDQVDVTINALRKAGLK